MNRATERTFKSLEHHWIARVRVVADTVELGIPESEGWRLVIAAALDDRGDPTLVARWEPGLRPPYRRRALKRAMTRYLTHRARLQHHSRPERRPAPSETPAARR